MKIKTKLAKLGRDPRKNKGFINPGIFKGSTILFKNFKSYLKDLNKKHDIDSLYYGINNNPICNEFEKVISNLYKAADAVTVSSGLTAVIIPLLTYLKHGDHVLISDA